jgi:hypothetical protein
MLHPHSPRQRNPDFRGPHRYRRTIPMCGAPVVIVRGAHGPKAQGAQPPWTARPPHPQRPATGGAAPPHAAGAGRPVSQSERPTVVSEFARSRAGFRTRVKRTSSASVKPNGRDAGGWTGMRPAGQPTLGTHPASSLPGTPQGKGRAVPRPPARLATPADDPRSQDGPRPSTATHHQLCVGVLWCCSPVSSKYHKLAAILLSTSSRPGSLPALIAAVRLPPTEHSK